MREENSNWDTYDFQDWVVRNISLILSGKQLELFIKNNFGYNDLKLFGRVEEGENLKILYQTWMVDKTLNNEVLNYSGKLQWTN